MVCERVLTEYIVQTAFCGLNSMWDKREPSSIIKYRLFIRDAIHTHFVTVIGKWMMSFLLTHPVFLSALSRDVTNLLNFDLPTLPRLSAGCLTQPPTIVNLPISVTKWVWMASLRHFRAFIHYLLSNADFNKCWGFVHSFYVPDDTFIANRRKNMIKSI